MKFYFIFNKIQLFVQNHDFKQFKKKKIENFSNYIHKITPISSKAKKEKFNLIFFFLNYIKQNVFVFLHLYLIDILPIVLVITVSIKITK